MRLSRSGVCGRGWPRLPYYESYSPTVLRMRAFMNGLVAKGNTHRSTYALRGLPTSLEALLWERGFVELLGAVRRARRELGQIQPKCQVPSSDCRRGHLAAAKQPVRQTAAALADPITRQLLLREPNPVRALPRGTEGHEPGMHSSVL